MIEQAKLTYFPIGKAFEKQIKTIKDQGIKQVETLKALKLENSQEPKSIEELLPKETGTTNEYKNEKYEIKKCQEKIKQKDLISKANKYIYSFQQFETIRSFSDSMDTGKIDIDEAEKD